MFLRSYVLIISMYKSLRKILVHSFTLLLLPVLANTSHLLLVLVARFIDVYSITVLVKQQTTFGCISSSTTQM